MWTKQSREFNAKLTKLLRGAGKLQAQVQQLGDSLEQEMADYKAKQKTALEAQSRNVDNMNDLNALEQCKNELEAIVEQANDELRQIAAKRAKLVKNLTSQASLLKLNTEANDRKANVDDLVTKTVQRKAILDRVVLKV